MKQNKPIILLGVALAIALITSLLSYSWLQKRAQLREGMALKTHPLAVATMDIPWGKVITKEMITMKPFLGESCPPGCFTNGAKVFGRVLTYPIKKDELISESRLAPASIVQGGVAAILPVNKRAMAIKVDKVVGVSGFIHPGNRVDVLVTLNKEKGKSENPITKVVLQNVLVLAAGSDVEEKGKKEKPAQVDVITLEVTPEEGEKLALAATEGKVQLALRNYTDTESVFTRGTTVPYLLASYSPADPPNNPVKRVTVKKKSSESQSSNNQKPEQVKKAFFTVQLIKGNKVSEVNFERGEDQ
ncbi:MAG: Flp pilus assembly protein CpaB [Deltaproteobacteria bacterium]|nr:Flp pilus assembly protein CpaB [Deltaproteobacteria bacterium]